MAKRKKPFWYDYEMLKLVQAEYQCFEDDISKIVEQTEKYKEQLKQDYNFMGQPLNFREQYELYSTINELFQKSPAVSKLEMLRKRLLDVYPEVAKYLRLKSELNELRRRRDDILSSIVFNEFIKDEDSRALCSDHHFLVYTGEELYCERCKATTKDYDLSLEDILFLSKCAAKQAELLSDKKEDIPLIRVLMEKLENEKKNREIPEQMPKLKADELREIYDSMDHTEVSDMHHEIVRAHKIDNGEFAGTPEAEHYKYISDKQRDYYFYVIESERKEIESSDSQNKDLLLELCKIAEFEVRILAGESIPEMMRNIASEDEIALTKAYYNLSNKSFRINSTYFIGENAYWDSRTHNYITADPKINQNILDLKLKR
ncbi:MAG: hypothetical protein IJA94_00895 [Bacilli bacterium]|nr:hypothetical protein [Bacilli bacterium]